MNENLIKTTIKLLSEKDPSTLLTYDLDWQQPVPDSSLFIHLLGSGNENIYNYMLLDKKNHDRLATNKETLSFIVKKSFPDLFRLNSTPAEINLLKQLCPLLDKNKITQCLLSNRVFKLAEINAFRSEKLITAENFTKIFNLFGLGKSAPTHEIIYAFFDRVYYKAGLSGCTPRVDLSGYGKMLSILEDIPFDLNPRTLRILIGDLAHTTTSISEYEESHEQQNKKDYSERLAKIINRNIIKNNCFELFPILFECHHETFPAFKELLLPSIDYLEKNNSPDFSDPLRFSATSLLNLYSHYFDDTKIKASLAHLLSDPRIQLKNSKTEFNLYKAIYYNYLNYNSDGTASPLIISDLFSRLDLKKVYNIDKDSFTDFTSLVAARFLNQEVTGKSLDLTYHKKILKIIFSRLGEEAIFVTFQKAIKKTIIDVAKSNSGLEQQDYQKQIKELNAIKEKILLDFSLFSPEAGPSPVPKL